MLPLLASFAFSFAAAPELTPELLFPPHQLHNHSPSIAQLVNGDLLIAFYRGSGEAEADDVQILGMRKAPGAAAWSEPFVLADTPGFPDLNPVLFVDPQKRLWLFYVTYLDNSTKGVLVSYRVSTQHRDAGAPTWDRSEILPIRPDTFAESFSANLDKIAVDRVDDLKTSEGLQRAYASQREQVASKLGVRLGWMTRTQPIMVGDRMLLGLYHDVFACSLAGWTDNAGKTWGFSAPIQSVYLGGIQPAIAQRKDGTLVALMRDNGKLQYIRQSESTDNGASWSTVIATDIPNPGSSVSLHVLQSGAWLLLCNDAKDNRERLAAYLSDDEGRSWPIRRVIADLKEQHGEAHYPSAIQSADGAIHVTYSHGLPRPTPDTRAETIAYATFDESWVRQGMRGDVLAFPGAEGYGRFTLGGRGGDVYHVTNLDDDGPGSLRQGFWYQEGPRTIVFDVGGTITLKKPIEIREKSHITIAGQTAPGDGITLRDNGLQIKNSTHIIVRYLRIRLGDKNNQGGDQDVITANYCDKIEAVET